MKKILSSLFAIVLFIGCTTQHLKPAARSVAPALRPASVVPVVAVQAPAPVTNTVPEASSDLAALRQSYQTSPIPVTNGITPARAATVKEPLTTPPPPAASSPKSLVPSVAATPSKSHSLIFWLVTTVLAVPLTWLAQKYGLPLFKKLLAWLKRKNVVADLKSLATEAESKLAVDFKDVENVVQKAEVKVGLEKAPAPIVVVHTTPVAVPTLPTGAQNVAPVVPPKV